VRGLGRWLAVDLTADKATRAPFTDDTVSAIADRMRELGVLVSKTGAAFELAPPLRRVVGAGGGLVLQAVDSPWVGYELASIG